MFAFFIDHTSKLFASFNILEFPHLIDAHTANFAYLSFNNHNPHVFKDYFTYKKDICNYNTRQVSDMHKGNPVTKWTKTKSLKFVCFSLITIFDEQYLTVWETKRKLKIDSFHKKIRQLQNTTSYFQINAVTIVKHPWTFSALRYVKSESLAALLKLICFIHLVLQYKVEFCCTQSIYGDHKLYIPLSQCHACNKKHEFFFSPLSWYVCFLHVEHIAFLNYHVSSNWNHRCDTGSMYGGLVKTQKNYRE